MTTTEMQIIEEIGYVSTLIDWTIQDSYWSGDANKLGVEEYWALGYKRKMQSCFL